MDGPIFIYFSIKKKLSQLHLKILCQKGEAPDLIPYVYI